MSDRKPRIPRGPKLYVPVTQEIIDSAVPRDSGYCMFAEAIKKCLPGITKVAVDLQTIRFSDPDKRKRYCYLTPRICQVALVNFDQGTKPEPFIFRLRVRK